MKTQLNIAEIWNNITNWYQNSIGRSNSRVLLSRTPDISFSCENIPGETTRNKNNMYIIRKSYRLKTNASWNAFDILENKIETNNDFINFNPVYKKWTSRSNLFRINITHRNRRTSRQRY